MKRLSALSVILILLLSGCSYLKGTGTNATGSWNKSSEAKLLTISDSTSVLDIYPEDTGYTLVGKFERYQFGNLTELQKSIYITLDNAVCNMKTGYIDVGVCSYRDLEIAYYALRTDRPEYFWLPSEYSLKVFGKDRLIKFADSPNDWNCSEEERKNIEAQIKTRLSSFCKRIGTEASEYERELAVHDEIISTVDYNHQASSSPEEYSAAWTVWGALCNGSAVCEGYSKSVQLMCYMLGINCSTITGITSGPHMWNTVKINGKWYNLDATADDNGDGLHSYFNVTDDVINLSRSIDADASNISDEELNEGRYNYRLQKCNSTESSYYSVNSSYIINKSQLKSAVTSLICAEVRSGGSSIEIGFAPELGFVYGKTSVEEFCSLEKYIAAANAELSPTLQLTAYNCIGVTGASGFKITW